jgi:hypothetical protein
MSDLNIFETITSDEETGETIIGGISAPAYLRQLNREDDDSQYKRFENLVVPFGLQSVIPLSNESAEVHMGGSVSAEEESEFSMMSTNDYERMFRLIAKDLGNSRSTSFNKTKKIARK